MAKKNGRITEKGALKHKAEESYNPFDDVFFWIRLACTDFSSVLCGEGTRKEPDARRGERPKR
ncbi:MAG: hypothetical protein LBL44_12315 [Treponema sp.]|nr:hypothetical protein [Treponema sp.]